MTAPDAVQEMHMILQLLHIVTRNPFEKENIIAQIAEDDAGYSFLLSQRYFQNSALSNILDGAFCENISWHSAVNCFRKTFYIFDRAEYVSDFHSYILVFNQ